MDVRRVREGLADALAGIPGVQVSPYVLAQPSPPGIQIIPPGATYNYSYGGPGVGLSEREFIVQGFVALTSDIGAQILLDDLCADTGPFSVRAAVELEPTLGGAVHTVTVTSQTPGRQVEQPPGNPMLLVEWHLTIIG